MTPRPEKPSVERASVEKGVMGNKRPEVSRSSFLRELKRAARGLLDKRGPRG